MSIATLVCTIAQAYGALTAYPGIVESQRYAESTITITEDDIVIDGPFDKRYSYDAHNLVIKREQGAGLTIITAESPSGSADYLLEVFIITDSGRLIWTSSGSSGDVSMAAGAVYSGRCE